MARTTSGAGRPRRSSRRTLEEAAAELFLEQTYDGTTIDQIAQRAGVSRNTFFNYYDAKSDLLWVDFDETIGTLGSILSEMPVDVPAMPAVERALLRVADDHPSGRVPWALTQYELMGTLEELKASGLARFLAVSALLEEFIASRVSADGGVSPLMPRAAASAVTAAAATAAGAWASAGVERGTLSSYVAEAIAPVCAGFAR